MKGKKTKHGVNISQTYGMKERLNTIEWILTAHRSRAQIFERKGNNLKLIQDMLHPEGRLKDREMLSDRPGRSYDSHTQCSGGHLTATPRHALGHEKGPKQRVLRQFTKLIAERIEAARREHRFAQLTLIAEPQLIGKIKEHLSNATCRVIKNQLEKDFAWLSEAQLKNRLHTLCTPAEAV